MSLCKALGRCDLGNFPRICPTKLWDDPATGCQAGCRSAGLHGRLLWRWRRLQHLQPPPVSTAAEVTVCWPPLQCHPAGPLNIRFSSKLAKLNNLNISSLSESIGDFQNFRILGQLKNKRQGMDHVGTAVDWLENQIAK